MDKVDIAQRLFLYLLEINAPDCGFALTKLRISKDKDLEATIQLGKESTFICPPKVWRGRNLTTIVIRDI